MSPAAGVVIPLPARLPVPSPARQAELSAFAGLLFEMYGPVRATWPHPDAWPWGLLPGAAGGKRLRLVR